jgi:hypothetical protein
VTCIMGAVILSIVAEDAMSTSIMMRSREGVEMHAAVADLACGAPTRGRPGALDCATPARRSWVASTGSTPPVGCGSGDRGVRELVGSGEGGDAAWGHGQTGALACEAPARRSGPPRSIRTSGGLWEWHRGRKRAR